MMPVLPHGEPFTAVPAKNAPNLSCFPWSVKPRLVDHYRILRAMPTHTMQLCIRRTVWRRMVHSEVSETWSVHLPTRNTAKTSAGAACIRAWRRRKPKKDQNRRDLYRLQSAAIPFRQKLPKPLCIVFTHPNPRTLINRSTYSPPFAQQAHPDVQLHAEVSPKVSQVSIAG